MPWTKEAREKGLKRCVEVRTQIRDLLKRDPILWKQYNEKRHCITYTKNNAIELTEKQKQLILGTLLGDSCIDIARTCKHPRVRGAHTIRQTEYTMWIYSELSNLFASKPKTRIDKINGKLHEQISFQTRSLRCLLPIYNIVVVNGKKTITEAWIQAISNNTYHGLALAMLYMDDGGLSHKTTTVGNKSASSMNIALGNKTITECEILRDWIKQEFGIPSSIHIKNHLCKNGEYEKILYITGIKNMLHFKTIIEPYVTNDMQYKIDIKYRNNQ
jgi:hypothetical protein